MLDFKLVKLILYSTYFFYSYHVCFIELILDVFNYISHLKSDYILIVPNSCISITKAIPSSGIPDVGMAFTVFL